MRAPPLASMAAVPAPRPDAEPVTIAHKPSFDIRISSCDLEPAVETHHIVPQNACKSAKLRCAELMPAAAVPFMWPLQGHLRTSALVMAMAFPHHAVQEKTPPMLGAKCLGAKPDLCGLKRGTPWRRVRTLLPRPRRRYFRISRTRKPSTTTGKAPGRPRCGGPRPHR